MIRETRFASEKYANVVFERVDIQWCFSPSLSHSHARAHDVTQLCASRARNIKRKSKTVVITVRHIIRHDGISPVFWRITFGNSIIYIDDISVHFPIEWLSANGGVSLGRLNKICNNGNANGRFSALPQPKPQDYGCASAHCAYAYIYNTAVGNACIYTDTRARKSPGAENVALSHSIAIMCRSGKSAKLPADNKLIPF